MLKVENGALIEALENFYLGARTGLPVRGVEEMKRTWYANEGVGRYQACIWLHGRLTPIYAIPFETIQLQR